MKKKRSGHFARVLVEPPARYRAHPVCEKIWSGHFARVLGAPPARTQTHPVRQKIRFGHRRLDLAVHPRRGPARRARRKLITARQRRIRCVGATQTRGRWNACTARPVNACSRQLHWMFSRGIAQRVSAARGLSVAAGLRVDEGERSGPSAAQININECHNRDCPRPSGPSTPKSKRHPNSEQVASQLT